MKRDISKYEFAYMADYGFETVMVAYRRRLLLERLVHYAPKIVLEIGCGSELLYKDYLKLASPVDCWIIVEAGEQFANCALDSNLPNLRVLRGFFEDVVEQVHALLPDQPQFIICSSILHEIPNVRYFLYQIAKVMGENTFLHVNVPNATSLHRQLAKSMGLIENLKVLSNRNKKLFQQRVYDQNTLKQDLNLAGFKIIMSGGYMVKPFSHDQMESITPELGSSVMDGLYQLGKDSPDLASEIFVEARKV